ncbi:MAG: CHAT domain-containing tetratricopeptide repeat protein [Hyphomicrobiaceae bacterium]
MRRAMLLVGLIAALAIGSGGKVSAQQQDIATLTRQIEQMVTEGRVTEALPIARRAIDLMERERGPNDLELANAMNALALLHMQLGQYADAEPLYKRALSIREKVLGNEHTAVGATLHSLAALYVYQGHYMDAEALYQRALGIKEKALGPDHSQVATTLHNLAVLLAMQGRYGEAEPIYMRALAIKEKTLGPEHTDVGSSLYAVAELYVRQGRFLEAEPLYKRTLAIKENALGLNHSEVGTTLYGLAALYVYLGRFEEAEPLYRRTLAIKETLLGPEHSEVGSTLHNLAVLLALQGRTSEAEQLYRRVIAIKENALSPDHTEVGSALYGMAELYGQQGRHAEAEPLYRRALAIKEKTLGPDHTEVGTTLFGLAALYAAQGRAAEAEPLYLRTLAIKQKALGADHPEVSTTLTDLALLHWQQGHLAQAVEEWRRSAAAIIRRSKRETEASAPALTAKGQTEARRKAHLLAGFIKAARRLAELEPAQALQLAHETFIMAQWAQSSEAAHSLSQMAVRQAKGDGVLAGLVRERQDLLAEWQARDQTLVATRAQPPELRDAIAEAALSTRLATIDTRISEVDRQLARDFPEFASLASPEPLDIAQVQKLLGANETLLLVLDTRAWAPSPEETLIWAVTKTDARWVTTDLGTSALNQHVAALRCGLDQAAWADASVQCAHWFGSTASNTHHGMLPFDLGRAYDVYQSLFGQVADLIASRELLIVASGALTALPFQVLVTDKPAVALPTDGPGYAGAAWLAKTHAISVLPSVGSLNALRQFAKASRARQPFLGFGNPLLLGPTGSDRHAWERQTCDGSAVVQVAQRGVRGSIAPFYRGGLADVAIVRAQVPLPETADELCAVAKSMAAAESNVYLGAKATEQTVKNLSADGTLAHARVIHFATHGLLAGETEMLTSSRVEPALLLTPPDQATETDDGLLTASEISQLKLDADWVVLSACNTAAGESDKPGSESLSGLARAFFYAGARALLVSHWAVNSHATVRLITGAFQATAQGQVGRAEATRRSMLTLIGSGGTNAHPSSWAPFVLVGDGAL